MQLDEGSLTFNANPDEVSELLLTVINNNCDCFFYNCSRMKNKVLLGFCFFFFFYYRDD